MKRVSREHCINTLIHISYYSLFFIIQMLHFLFYIYCIFANVFVDQSYSVKCFRTWMREKRLKVKKNYNKNKRLHCFNDFNQPKTFYASPLSSSLSSQLSLTLLVLSLLQIIIILVHRSMSSLLITKEAFYFICFIFIFTYLFIFFLQILLEFKLPLNWW